MAHTWDDLAAATLARQFPADPPASGDPSPREIAAAVHAIGPIQSQNARAPFLGLAARFPGVTRAGVSAAYEELGIVRGSTLRGTVHTSTPDDHALLDAVTRVGQRALWARTLRLRETSLEEVWAAIEDHAHDVWRSPAELLAHLLAWLAEHDPSAEHRLDNAAGRYFAFGHGGLLRRPVNGDWAGQGAPGYRTAAALLGDRSAILADPETAVTELTRRHLTAYGPASRHDIAWWAGIGLTQVDAALARLAPELAEEVGPDGRTHWSLTTAAPPSAAPGVRLLPEFDALLCAFDPPARARFVVPEHYQVLWQQENGRLLAPLLLDGRLTGHWHLSGRGRRRTLDVGWFAGTRRPRRAELDAPIAGVETALDLSITAVTVARV